jgi:hypothetical protein
MPDPLADPVARRRLAAVQTLYLALGVGLAGIAFGVGLVVGYALDWQPLAGNLVTVGGVSAVTLAAAVVTALTPPLALWVGRRRAAAERRAVAAVHPEVVGTPEFTDRALAGFAAATFAEAIVTVGVGFAWSVLTHVTSDWLMFPLVAVLLVWLAVRYPTAGRLRPWLTAGPPAPAAPTPRTRPG